MDTTRLHVRPPCTRNQRPAASLDTVRHEQRSSEKRGHIYRTGLLTEGTHEAHRFPCCFNETLSLAEHAATYKRRPLLGAPRTSWRSTRGTARAASSEASSIPSSSHEKCACSDEHRL